MTAEPPLAAWNCSIAATERSILALASALNVTTVAEGLETDAQVTALRAMGCQTGKGYYYSRPLRRADAERLVRKPRANPPKPRSAVLLPLRAGRRGSLPARTRA